MTKKYAGQILQERRASWGKDISTKVVGVNGDLTLILQYKTVRTGFYPEFFVIDEVRQQTVDCAMLTYQNLRDVCSRHGFDYETAHKMTVQ